MQTISKKWSLRLGLLSALTFGSAFAEETTTENWIDQYPTQARVEYVLGCMARYGGEHYNNMYGCVCAIDALAKKIPYNNFVATQTLAVMMQLPGDQGGPYRDAEGGREAIKAFQTFQAETEQACGLKKPAKAKKP